MPCNADRGKRGERQAALSLSPSLWRRLWLGQSGIDPRATAKDEERDEKICTMSGGREGHTGLFNNAFANQIRPELRAKGMCSCIMTGLRIIDTI